MRKRKTGMELFGKLLCRGKYGPIKNAFVISALERFIDEVLKEDLPQNFIINPEAWKGVAQEIRNDLVEAFPHY